ncbi:MAG: FtsQ-type POTRA domain-containing protein, partial [Acidobacteriota bacterium]|nr:FtsQ-type POTRA domain-containing protein [Acidobacteriota bacterium]
MLREQVIIPRAGRNSPGGKAQGDGVIAQRPVVKRGRGNPASGGKQSGRKSSRRSWNSVLGYAPLALKCLLAIGLGVLIFATYRAAASASFFRAEVVDIEGTSRAAKDDLRALVRRAAASSGVWDANLERIGAELREQPWVRSVVVSRVLPSGLRVRVTEREPRAVVRTSAGRFVWVDEDGVSLGTLSPTDRMPSFFMRGWDESGGADARAENRERVAKYVEVMRDWESAGLAERVSEVNLDDLRDVRVQLAGDDSRIEVRLGKEKMGERLQQALKVLDEQRQTPRGPFITYIDLTPGTRAVVGTNVKAQQAQSATGVVDSNKRDDAASSTATQTADRHR